MNKYCPKCGTGTDINARFCPKCGEEFLSQQAYSNPTQNYQGSVSPQQSGYQTQQPGQMNFILIQQLSQKIKSAAIFWLVFGILGIIGGIALIISGAALNSSYLYNAWGYRLYSYHPGTGSIVYGSFVLAVAIVNIIYAVIHFGYAKMIFTNPAVITNKVHSPVLYIISIVMNVINIIGIIGGIMMLNARSLARSNQVVFYNQTPNNNVPPYTPQQNATPYTPVQPPEQPSAPVQTINQTPNNHVPPCASQQNAAPYTPVQPPEQPSAPVQATNHTSDQNQSSAPVEKTDHLETHTTTSDADQNNSNN